MPAYLTERRRTASIRRLRAVCRRLAMLRAARALKQTLAIRPMLS